MYRPTGLYRPHGIRQLTLTLTLTLTLILNPVIYHYFVHKNSLFATVNKGTANDVKL